MVSLASPWEVVWYPWRLLGRWCGIPGVSLEGDDVVALASTDCMLKNENVIRVMTMNVTMNFR